MRIGLVELYERNHYSLIVNWLLVCRENGWDCTLYATNEILANVAREISGFAYDVVAFDGISLGALREIRADSIRRGCFLVFLSLSGSYWRHLFCSFAGAPHALTVHNAYAWMGRGVLRKPWYLFKKFLRWKMRRAADAIVVNSDPMAKAMEGAGKPVFVMPFSLLRTPGARTARGASLTIVCPGKIEAGRKRYEDFLRLAADFPEHKFALLGKPAADPRSRAVYEAAGALPNVARFDRYLSVEEFRAGMLEADLLFSDIVVEYDNSDYHEVYGVSKDSGFSYLMAEYGLPGIVNAGFRNLDYLDCGTFYFRDYAELRSIILKAAERGVIEGRKASIARAVAEHGPERYARSLAGLEAIASRGLPGKAGRV